MTDIILTGIPRSGTSFVCSLLNKVKNTLALVEPLDMRDFMLCASQAERIEFIDQFFYTSREKVHSKGKVDMLDFSSDTNTFSSQTNRFRKSTVIGFKEQLLNKDLTENFNFIIKHPNAFTALLPELTGKWKCVAIVRNPVSVIASWSSLDHPLRRGYAPMAMHFDGELRSRLESRPCDLSRQVELMNWFFRQYSKHLSSIDILYYEKIVASGGRNLSRIAAEADNLRETIETMNKNKIYDSDKMSEIAQNLLDSGGEWQKFYSLDEISNFI